MVSLPNPHRRVQASFLDSCLEGRDFGKLIIDLGSSGRHDFRAGRRKAVEIRTLEVQLLWTTVFLLDRNLDLLLYISSSYYLINEPFNQ